MKVNTNELRVAFDVDQTLIMHTTADRSLYSVIDPYTGKEIFIRYHTKHIDLLKSYKARGYDITVWSANGYKWAETIVKALNLESYVDGIESKYIKFVDDLEAHEVLGQRVYINE